MKVKASWAAFVPFTVGAVVLHIYHLFFLGGDEITQQLFAAVNVAALTVHRKAGHIFNSLYHSRYHSR